LDTIFVATIGPVATYFLPICGLAAVALYSIFRLKSTQIIREKIWNFCVGDKDFFDEKLKSFAHEQLDLAHYRLLYGVSARSITDLHRLLSWIGRHKLIPNEVKRVRGWIDPSRDEVLKIPNGGYFVRRSVAVILLIPIIVGLMTASECKETLLKMKDSGTWFASDGQTVRAVWGQWQIDAESCKTGMLPDSKITGFTSTEITDVCKGISSGELKDIVRGPVKFQHWSFGIIVFLVFFLEVGIFLKINSAADARNLGVRLDPSKKERTGNGRFRKKPIPLLR
jgi:hypothetical protein